MERYLAFGCITPVWLTVCTAEEMGVPEWDIGLFRAI